MPVNFPPGGYAAFASRALLRDRPEERLVTAAPRELTEAEHSLAARLRSLTTHAQPLRTVVGQSCQPPQALAALRHGSRGRTCVLRRS